MSGVLNYLPPADGLLPKWLLFVRSPPFHPNQTINPLLISPSDLHSLDGQQHPGLHLPRPHPKSLLRAVQHTDPLRRKTPRRPSPKHNPDHVARDAAVGAHLRDLDGHHGRRASLRRVPHRAPPDIRACVLDVRGRVGALHERVVDLQDDQMGEWVGGPGDCVDHVDDMDVVAVGFLCQEVGR